jgi:hypothetical protein
MRRNGWASPGGSTRSPRVSSWGRPGPSKNKGKEGQPAIFHVFKTQKLELIVTEKMKSEKWVKDFVKKGVTLVEVPEDDPDHAPVAKERKSKRQRSLDKLARKARKEAEENQPSLVD